MKKSKWFRIFFFFLAVALSVGCNRLLPDPSLWLGGSNNSEGSSGPTTPVALLSAEQILKAMIAATGTEGLGDLSDPADELIDRTFRERSGSLPSLNGLEQATAPTMIAVTNLASAVCAKAVDRDRATSEAQSSQRLFFREMNFSSGISAQNETGASLGFSRIARNAWRRNVIQSEADAVTVFVQDFTSRVTNSDPANSRMLAISVCTAALSSIDALSF